MKDFFIENAARHENAVVTSYFLLSSVSARDKKGGGQYLALTLTDRTGSFDARMWEEFADVLQQCSAGCYVKAQGRVERYQGRFQMSLQKLRNAAESEVEPGDFQPATQYNVDALDHELRGYVDEFQNTFLQRLVLSFLDDPELGPAFRTAPAAKMLHHAWLGGLLEHVVFLVRLCRRVAPQYADEVDPDLLVAAAILHDFGKVRELAWKRSFSYTTEGQLLGHITIGIGLMRDKIAAIPGFPERLRILLEHILLSHHGKYEFGSPKLPMTPEAVVFSALDDLEAKLQNMRAEFSKAREAGRAADEVTDYSRSMERALLDSRSYLAGDPAMANAMTAPKTATPESAEPTLAAAETGDAESAEPAAIPFPVQSGEPASLDHTEVDSSSATAAAEPPAPTFIAEAAPVTSASESEAAAAEDATAEESDLPSAEAEGNASAEHAREGTRYEKTADEPGPAESRAIENGDEEPAMLKLF